MCQEEKNGTTVYSVICHSSTSVWGCSSWKLELVKFLTMVLRKYRLFTLRPWLYDELLLEPLTRLEPCWWASELVDDSDPDADAPFANSESWSLSVWRTRAITCQLLVSERLVPKAYVYETISRLTYIAASLGFVITSPSPRPSVCKGGYCRLLTLACDWDGSKKSAVAGTREDLW